MQSSIVLSRHAAHAGANRRRRAESAAVRLTDQPDVRPSLRTEAYESTTRTDDLLDLLVRSGAPLRQPLRAASVEPYAQQRIADECWTIVNRGGGRTTENECETEIENDSVSASSSASIPPFLNRSDDEMIAGGAHVPLKAMPMGSTFGAEQLFGTSLGRDKVASFIDGDDEAYSDVYCLTPAGYRPLKSIVVYRMMALTVALMLLVLGVCAASSHIQDGYRVRNGIHREKLMSSLRSESEYALQRRNALRGTF